MERQRIWQESGWNYQLLENVEENRVKVRIHCDPYDFQSYARAYVWSDAELKWNLAASVPYEDMESLLISGYPGTVRPAWPHFEMDENTLLEEVRWLLGS